MAIGASCGGLQRRKWVRALCKSDNEFHCHDARKTSKRKRNQSDKNCSHAANYQVVSSRNVKSLNSVRNISFEYDVFDIPVGHYEVAVKMERTRPITLIRE